MSGRAPVAHVLDTQLVTAVQVLTDRGVGGGKRERGAHPDGRLRLRDGLAQALHHPPDFAERASHILEI